MEPLEGSPKGITSEDWGRGGRESSSSQKVNSEGSVGVCQSPKGRGDPSERAQHEQRHNTVSAKAGTRSWCPLNQALKQEHYRESKNMCRNETNDRN